MPSPGRGRSADERGARRCRTRRRRTASTSRRRDGSARSSPRGACARRRAGPAEGSMPSTLDGAQRSTTSSVNAPLPHPTSTQRRSARRREPVEEPGARDPAPRAHHALVRGAVVEADARARSRSLVCVERSARLRPGRAHGSVRSAIAVLVDALDDAHVAVDRVAEHAQRLAVRGAVVGGERLRDAVEFPDTVRCLIPPSYTWRASRARGCGRRRTSAPGPRASRTRRACRRPSRHGTRKSSRPWAWWRS